MWEQFEFPQLTADEDMQLTIALQGGITQPTTSTETRTTMNHNEATTTYPHMRFGVQDPAVQERLETSASRSSFSPPPYMPAFSEITSNSQPMNHREAYIVLDGVCHVLRVRELES